MIKACGLQTKCCYFLKTKEEKTPGSSPTVGFASFYRTITDFVYANIIIESFHFDYQGIKKSMCFLRLFLASRTIRRISSSS